MTPSPKPLGRHIAPALDEARLERQIAAIVKRGAPRRPVASFSRRQAVAAAVCLVVGGSVAWRLTKVTRAEPTEPNEQTLAVAGTTVETRAGGETITLADGSRAVLAPKSKLTLMTVRPDIVRVALEEGGVDLDVVHAEGKEFVVVARGYEIRVLGTRFRVRLLEGAGAARLEVAVARGRVRVTHAGKPDDADLRVLGAGETWTATLDAERPVSASAPAVEASADTAPVPRPAAVGAGEAPRSCSRAPRRRAPRTIRAARRGCSMRCGPATARIRGPGSRRSSSAGSGSIGWAIPAAPPRR